MNTYENALNKSIKQGTSKRVIYKKGIVKGLKTGILVKSVSAIILAGLGSMGYKKLTTKMVNTSYVISYEAMHKYAHIVPETKGKYWVDYTGLANEYNPKTTDFNSFIYGAYVTLPPKEREENMDELIKRLRSRGYTKYTSFLEYCMDKDLTKKVDGKLVVDTSKYIKTIRKYMIKYNKEQEESKNNG